MQYSHCQQISEGKDRAKIRIIKKQRGERVGKRVAYHLVLCHWAWSRCPKLYCLVIPIEVPLETFLKIDFECLINDRNVFGCNQVPFLRYTAFNRTRINILKLYA